MYHGVPIRRRQFLASAASVSAAGLFSPSFRAAASDGHPRLLAGEGVADITPPLGIEMGGFHRPPGEERRIQAIRQPTAVRALVLELGGTQVVICSLDVAAIGRDMADRIRREAARQTDIPEANIRVAATHTHSMPGFCFLRQWGAIPTQFMAEVEKQTIEAVRRAKIDLAPAELALGKSRVNGGNHNRTVKTCGTDEEFTTDSTDEERWLDTALHALVFHRCDKSTLIWYHFSAHAVCYADEQAGPDWPGMVADLLRHEEGIEPSFLQGHCGDVNPGDGSDWRGEANQTVGSVYPALRQAITAAAPVKVDRLRTLRAEFLVPLDIPLFKAWLDQYQKDPDGCTGGPWVDAGFAADWYKANANRNLSQTHLAATLSAVQLGEVTICFHPAEMYSYYGLAIRRDSTLRDTLVVGYTDGLIGYLADPKAYQANEYATVTVPKILDYPPFTPTAGRQLTAATVAMLKKLDG